MPSKSDKQRATMRAAANNPAFAAKVGIPVSVAQEYARADQARLPRRPFTQNTFKSNKSIRGR